MTYFLETIAEALHSEFGNTLNKHCLVFPNRRAGLYFLKYLGGIIEKPVWVPSILTINELFRSYSSLQPAGNEILLFELYKVYRKVNKSPESFDDFYFWGDMLLNDFDDIDKYLVDASKLFSNVQDIRKIDQQFGGLTEEQIEIVKRFWINFNHGKLTNEKSGFINIWSVLNEMYTGFRNTLKEKNLAYEGMIFRELAEKHDEETVSVTAWSMIHFIGFNALNRCEKEIMTRFKKAGRARFYWDYDNSYIKDGKLNSAGFFLRDNLKIFGNDMPSDWSYDTMLTRGLPEVSRRVIDTSSDLAQVKLISKLIEELPDLAPGNAHHTAVVLADENLLMPVLTSLPENMGEINITMGHPVKHTLVYTLVRHLMELQRSAIVTNNGTRFSYRHVIGIIKHTLISGMLGSSENDIINNIAKTNLIWVPSDRFTDSEYLARIFIRPSTPSLLSDYFRDILSMVALKTGESGDNVKANSVQRNIRNEFIYRVVLSINRLETICNTPEISFSTDTYMRILDRMLRIQSVPFSGEPLSGVQIMGILETRALDFKNLIILSVNEGVLPAVSAGASFIPYSLREAFMLPSLNYQESIYAYHFYRLLQRAENVTFAYNSNSEGLRSGEMSRFLVQMKYDPAIKPLFVDLNFEIKTLGTIQGTIERTEEHSRQLSSYFHNDCNGRILSPSAINTWLNCRMKFYYRYVNGLKEPERVTSDIDPAMLGNILHEIMKSLYQEFKGKIISEEFLNKILSGKKTVEKLTDEEINLKFSRGNDNIVVGNELIVRDVLMAYLMRILYADKSIAPFTILNLEDTFNFILPVGSDIRIKAGGKVDRIDLVNGVTRIVDYKTGSVADSINSINEMFIDDRKKDDDGWLQTLIYCEAYLSNKPESIVRPSVYKIKKIHKGYISDKLKIKTDSRSEIEIDDYNSIRNEFIAELKEVINIIFGKDEPFRMTSDIRGKCAFCSYRSLCMR